MTAQPITHRDSDTPHCGAVLAFRSRPEAPAAPAVTATVHGTRATDVQSALPVPPWPPARPGRDRAITGVPPVKTISALVRHGYRSGGLTCDQVWWLTRLPVQELGDAAAVTYNWLCDEQLGSLVHYTQRHLLT